MMSSKNSGFSATDIERYHSGQMSAQERHALEKAALDDPFLADALEGYAFTSTPVADVAAIQQRLDEKLDRKRVIPFFKRYRWLSAAAVFVILAGAGWFTYTALTPGNNNYAIAPNLEKQQENSTQGANSLPDSTGPVVTSSKTANNSETHEPAKTDTEPTRPVKSKSSRTSNTFKNEQVTMDEVRKDDEKKQINIDVASRSDDFAARRNVTRNVQQENSNEGNVANVRRNDVTMNRVMSPDPRANNAANIKREQLYYKDSNIETASIAGKVQGVDTTNSIREINVIMKPLKMDTAEVVVVGYGTVNQTREKYPRVTIDTLEPADGYGSYDSYVVSNLKMPEEIKSKTISGEVQLAFTVDKDGRPTNITVVKSLCQKCDEEAIRLLQEGPKWKQKRNKKGKITIKF